MEFTALWPGADAARTTRELGVGFRDVAETFRDTVSWMCGAGHLNPCAGREACGQHEPPLNGQREAVYALSSVPNRKPVASFPTRVSTATAISTGTTVATSANG
ncbi:MAG: hypothetical protein QOK18_1693 [Mycobacterium sp.]|nr:hypothetical protein [Mycobacterium sp.]